LSWFTYDEKIKHLVIPHLQFSDEIGHLCDITTQHYLGLPFHSSEAEKRIMARLERMKKDQRIK